MRNVTQTTLFDLSDKPAAAKERQGENVERLPRLDSNSQLRSQILPYCRLVAGGVWEDPVMGHRVGVLDAADLVAVRRILNGEQATLIVNDPPYNVVVGNANTPNLSKTDIRSYIEFSRRWVQNALAILPADGSLYVWMGTDYRDNFQPLPDFMILMRDYQDVIKPRNLITVRNQRGYGTQCNWMWVRQELLYYAKGKANFDVTAEYTDIPKVVRGYHKSVNGVVTENMERSKSENIRAGNVWIDIQQVFYRMEENVPGCYAQKPLRAIERIVLASSAKGDLVLDFFSHSGSTLLAGERLGRRVFTFDIDPVFAELTIRRLENFRRTGKTGWQWRNPFPELDS